MIERLVAQGLLDWRTSGELGEETVMAWNGMVQGNVGLFLRSSCQIAKVYLVDART